MIHVQTPVRSMVAILAHAAVLATVLVTSLPAMADKKDQVRAREAMLSGEVRPLTELLARVESLYAGEVIEVEMEEDETGFRLDRNGAPSLLYEIKLLTPQGNLVKLEFDAQTLELLTVDGHDSESARKKIDEKDD